MGMLIDGVWRDEGSHAGKNDGRFIRRETQFRDWVTADGSSAFKAEPGRYHLYVSLACPWAHRTLILRRLKGLERIITVSVVDPLMAEHGWTFSDGPGCIPDQVNGARYLHEIYVKSQPDYTGRVSVPVLWDKHEGRIVNNESSEIIRMLNAAFDAFGRAEADFYPEPLRPEIDAVNAVVFDRVNNGVYKAGFATKRAPYQEAVRNLFDTLDELEERLGRRRYLAGDRITEADWRLFTTLVRFDPVYHGHFKCNLRRLVDYPELWGYTRELYQVPGVAETVNIEHIQEHYYRSHQSINPTGIVPLGPVIDFRARHDRHRLAAVA